MKRNIFLLTLLFAITSFAQTVPSGMTYQGRLTDASNAPVPDGTGYEIEVRLWSAPTGGTLLWGTRYTGVPLKSGAFNLILGSGGTPIPGATTTDIKLAFNTPTVHLGLTPTRNATGAAISSPSEILPRQQIFSTPFAFKAATVEPRSIDVEALSRAVAERLLPVGSIIVHAGSVAPEGFVMCDGTTYDSSANSGFTRLYAVIGNTYGGSDGSNFRVPDLRGRVVSGTDTMGGTDAGRHSINESALLGGFTGTETHSHTIPRKDWNAEGGAFGVGPSGQLVVTSGEVEIREGLESLRNAGSDKVLNSESNLQPTIFLHYIIKL